MGLPQGHSLIPGGAGGIDQPIEGAFHGQQGHRVDRQALIAIGLPIGGAAMVAHDPLHGFGIVGIEGEGANLSRHLRRSGIAYPGHEGRERAANAASLNRVIANAQRHKQGADVGIAQAQGAEVIGPLRNLLRGELRHEDRGLQRQRPEAAGMLISCNVEAIVVFEESHEVQGRQVTGRIVQEHVF